MKAAEIMSANVYTVKKETLVEEIARMLVDNNISGVPVVEEDGRVVGMVTQKDLLYKGIEPRFPAEVELLGGVIFLQGVKNYNEELRKLVATRADQIMTKKVITIDEDTEVEEAARMMVEMDINRLPVVRDRKLVGIISRADVLRYIAKKMES